MNTARKTGKILVVDDDPVARALIRSSIENDGYELFEAEDAEAGIKALAEIGLVSSSRVGNSVHYELSERGRALCEVFA